MEKLKRLREERGLSQVKLAARADLNPATVNQIERGMRDASPGTLRKLADALEVSLYELMEEEAPKVKAPSSPDRPNEGGAGAAALLAWLEHLDLTLQRAKDLQGEFRELTEYAKNTSREERDPVVIERRIAWGFSRCLEFSFAVSRAVKAYRRHLMPLLEGGGLSPREGELLQAMRSRLEEIRPIRRRFLDLIEKTHHTAVDMQHAEKMLRDLEQELGVLESDAVPKDV